MSRARRTTRALATATLATGALLGVAPATVAAAAGTPATASGAGGVVRHPQHVRTADDPEATPLSVALTSMTPSTVPRRGVITLSGVVANSSGETWTDVNVAPFVSSTPMTTRDEVQEAAATVPSTTVGNRLVDTSTNVSVGDLRNGASARFTVRIRRDQLARAISGDPGVYWIGVHALGASAAGRDLVADGRARTFIPLVTPAVQRRRTVPVSVVLPLRERARRAADGSLNGPARWVALTSSGGRLSRLADFGATAPAQSLTWVVDPAVLDALDDFGSGNPPLSLGGRVVATPDDAAQDGSSSGASPSPSPSPSATATPLSGTPSTEDQEAAAGVLDTLLTDLEAQDRLTVGYSDPDVVALIRRRASLVTRSADLARRRMTARGLDADPVVAPVSGLFDPELLPRVSRDDLVLLSDRGRLTAPPSSRLPSGQQLVLGDQRAADGGPAPTDPTDALELRQRVLAEAALEAEKGAAAPRPVVLQLPAGWNPGARWREADFFGGLDTPWTRLTPLPRDPSTTYAGKLPYGAAGRAAEVRSANVDATRVLVRTGGVMGRLLANDNDVADRLTGAALQASSYSARPTLGLAAEQVLALDATARSQLDRIQVTGTDFVTLSGGSGTLTVTIVNGLEQPITVGLRARADSPDVRVESPDAVSMQPGQRTTLRLDVTSRSGVHDVTLFPVTSRGEELGTPLTFSLRTSQVGRAIWYLIIAGGVLLAVMIVRRIVLRIRLHRWRVREGS